MCMGRKEVTLDEEEEGGDSSVKKGHGGCGHIQPTIRKEGLKLFLNYKKLKDEDEVCLTTDQSFSFLHCF